MLLSGQFNLLSFIILAVLLIVALCIHEASHAFSADRLGDGTPRYLGRLTLNPLAHLDPLGTVMLLLVGFGWGKPVPINPFNFKNYQRDSALVALAGPASNIAMAIVAAVIVRLLPFENPTLYFIGSILIAFIRLNLLLGVFNLLPLGPLDGFKIVQGFLPSRLAAQWQQNELMSLILLVVILFLPINGTPVISFILNPIINVLFQILVGGS